MANYQNIISFILQAEGGFVNDPADQGGATNKGITYSTWKIIFGDTWNRFMAMSDADWQQIFVSLFWDGIKADQIQNQAIADFLVDWYWGSGIYAVGKDYYGTAYGVQPVLNSLGAQIAVDGQIGPQTLAAINAADSTALLDALRQNRSDFYNAIAQHNPSQNRFLVGWMNRLDSLYATVSTYVGDVVTAATNNPGTTVTALFFCLAASMWSAN
jgi:lysozyme family protein